ncbi:hypothetical protein Pcinc_019152 [Petrolisthes cinctipes]|uniref:VPS37 C-terminal domain-containing protein n=1 Tax=Petrolisthes cinctipes TaxID=88211 RepID=A0AAE1KN11_PETCI|nr:hypothetical protein Pcinc_019152 [Petrolisthes cinctipes]
MLRYKNENKGKPGKGFVWCTQNIAVMDTSLGSPHTTFPGPLTTTGGPLAEVSSLSRSELEDLLECEDKMAALVASMPPLATIRAQCDSLVAQNEALAKATLERSDEYERSRDAAIRKVEELNNLRQSFTDLTLAQTKASELLAPACIQESLVVAAMQSEEESEEIADQFLRKELGVEAFLSAYLEKRIETHLRKFKGERLGAQLDELHRAGF